MGIFEIGMEVTIQVFVGAWLFHGNTFFVTIFKPLPGSCWLHGELDKMIQLQDLCKFALEDKHVEDDLPKKN